MLFFLHTFRKLTRTMKNSIWVFNNKVFIHLLCIFLLFNPLNFSLKNVKLREDVEIKYNLLTRSFHLLHIARHITALFYIFNWADEAKDSSKQPYDNCLVAHDPLPYTQGPLLPLLAICWLCHKSHVEEWGEDEGEAGHKDGADELEDCAEAWEWFSKEKKKSNNEGAEHSSLHIKTSK